MLEFVEAVMRESASLELVSRPVWCLSESDAFTKATIYSERECFLATQVDLSGEYLVYKDEHLATPLLVSDQCPIGKFLYQLDPVVQDIIEGTYATLGDMPEKVISLNH